MIRLWDAAGLAIVLEPAHGRPGIPAASTGSNWTPPRCGGRTAWGRTVSARPSSGRGNWTGCPAGSYAVEAADTTLGRGPSVPVAGADDVLAERVEEEIVRHRVAAAQDTDGDDRT